MCPEEAIGESLSCNSWLHVCCYSISRSNSFAKGSRFVSVFHSNKVCWRSRGSCSGISTWFCFCMEVLTWLTSPVWLASYRTGAGFMLHAPPIKKKLTPIALELNLDACFLLSFLCLVPNLFHGTWISPFVSWFFRFLSEFCQCSMLLYLFVFLFMLNDKYNL